MGIDGGRGAGRGWLALAVAMKSATLSASRGALQPRQEDEEAVGGSDGVALGANRRCGVVTPAATQVVRGLARMMLLS
jgi:hypothetical protein